MTKRSGGPGITMCGWGGRADVWRQNPVFSDNERDGRLIDRFEEIGEEDIED